MQKTVVLLILIFGTVISSLGQKFDYSRDFMPILAKSKDPADVFYYDKLLIRFKANDSTLTGEEMLALLIGFTDKPEYKPYAVLKTERLIYKLNGEGKYQQALDTAQMLL